MGSKFTAVKYMEEKKITSDYLVIPFACLHCGILLGLNQNTFCNKVKKYILILQG